MPQPAQGPGVDRVPSLQRQILRSSFITASGSIISVAVGLLRFKAAALILGPAGVGLIGLIQNLMQVAGAVASLGFGTVGTRQVAEAVGREDIAAVDAARRALWWGNVLLAIVGATGFWMAREILAYSVLGAPERSDELGWVALGVGLSVVAGAQTALLVGMRRIGDVARVQVAAAVLAAAAGVAGIAYWGPGAIVLFVIATPAASFVVGFAYALRLPKIASRRTAMTVLAPQWASMARLGIAFTAAGFVGSGGQLAVKWLVQERLGTAELGQFQAAWMISVSYIGFVLQAMGTDYYPRLSAAIKDRVSASRIVNEQTWVALLLAAPVLLFVIGLSPWLIRLLYSSDFAPAASILQWQVLGDVLKVCSWPLGFVLLASGDGRRFFWVEAVITLVFVAVTGALLPIIGLPAPGIAFVFMYAAYLPVVFGMAREKIGLKWDRRVSLLTLALFGTCGAVMGLSAISAVAAAALGLSASLGFASFAAFHLADHTHPWVARILPKNFKRQN